MPPERPLSSDRRQGRTVLSKARLAEGDAPFAVETADAFGLILHHVAVFPLGLLHQPRQLLDAASQLRDFVVTRNIQLDRQTLGILLALDLVRQQLDTADNGAIDDKKHDQQHQAAGHGQAHDEMCARPSDLFRKTRLPRRPPPLCRPCPPRRSTGKRHPATSAAFPRKRIRRPRPSLRRHGKHAGR